MHVPLRKFKCCFKTRVIEINHITCVCTQVVAVVSGTGNAPVLTITAQNKTVVYSQISRQTSGTLHEVFQRFYDHRVWGEGGHGSGNGSTVPYTANIRSYLTSTITKYDITSILDAPCGDMAWMPMI